MDASQHVGATTIRFAPETFNTAQVGPDKPQETKRDHFPNFSDWATVSPHTRLYFIILQLYSRNQFDYVRIARHSLAIFNLCDDVRDWAMTAVYFKYLS